MAFGIMGKNSNDIHAVAVVTERTELHGRKLAPGNVIVEVRRIDKHGLLPSCPGSFDMDEPICVGGFYEWPSNRLALLRGVTTT